MVKLLPLNTTTKKFTKYILNFQQLGLTYKEFQLDTYSHPFNFAGWPVEGGECATSGGKSDGSSAAQEVHWVVLSDNWQELRNTDGAAEKYNCLVTQIQFSHPPSGAMRARNQWLFGTSALTVTYWSTHFTAVFNAHNTVNTLGQCTVHSVVYCTVYSALCTVYDVQCTLYSVHCAD